MHESTFEVADARSSSYWTWLGLALIAVLWFATLGSRQLLDPDEGRYAEIAQEMLVSGDWVTPRLNGIKYFEKPPLQYWMTASAYRVFGHNEFAARWWAGLCGFAGILLTGFTGTRLFGRAAGHMAAVITASSALYMTISHVNTLDMGLTFFLQLSMCSFLLAQRSALGSRTERNWMWLAWSGAALAFLSKGLVALILPALTLLVYSVVSREFSAWRRLHIGSGLPLFLLLVLPWLIAVSLANPEFPHFFFVHEQFERFLSNIHDRDGPWWYFLPFLLLGSLPWTFIALHRLTTEWQLDAAQPGFQTRRFLIVWIVTVIGFFSLSHSKLPPYILPVIPMLALLLGDICTRLAATALRLHLLVMASMLLVLALVVCLLPDNIAGAKAIAVVADLRPETVVGLVLISIAILAASWLAHRRALEAAVITAGLGTLFGLSVLIQATNALASTRSGYALAQQITPRLSPTTRLFSVADYNQTLPFYLGRHLTLVNYRGELDFGLSQEPELAIDSIEAFTRIWQDQGLAIAVMPPALYTELLNKGLPMQLIAQQAKWVAVSKP